MGVGISQRLTTDTKSFHLLKLSVLNSFISDLKAGSLLKCLHVWDLL